jgi:2,3-bisphosphoglycerate-independent phosphoglycerate mutase
MAVKHPLVLIILDGWGVSREKKHNAIAKASTPHWNYWWQTYPHLLLEASGEQVGLPQGQMGNSEVGHMHIGAGRIIPQDFTRINQAIEQGDFAKNPVFHRLLSSLKQEKKTLHVMGLLSDGGVHSHENHLFAFLSLCKHQGFDDIHLHLFLDGRDTSPQSALNSLNRLDNALGSPPVATLSSISGRYYAMDRDQRWPRIESVYSLLTDDGEQMTYPTSQAALNAFYQQGIYDEFIPPTRIGDGEIIKDGDAVFFFNFRADRARQLTDALISPDFQGFQRKKRPMISHFVSMTAYAPYLATEPAFPPFQLKNTLGEVLSQHGLKQLRLAETEKYAHVTFFLNGGSEEIFANEERRLIPSPPVATYDKQPEMSAKELTHVLIDEILSQKVDVIICNYANADMVGHTGNFDATVCAIECLDRSMHAVWQALQSVGGHLLITADHGNAETMYDDNIGQAHTAHTTHPVPLLYVGHEGWQRQATTGSLIDVAPTLLSLLNIHPPKEMTGKALLVKHHD